MKKFQTLIVLAVFVSQLVNPFTLNTKAAVLGDNYPSQQQTGWGPDTWGMYKRQCTSFVAFRLSSANGFTLPTGYRNADSWGHIARSQGYSVDMQATVGAVAWFDKGVNYSHQDYGHVAWVAEVNGNQVTLEEYNYNAGQGPEKYHRRTIAMGAVSGYIHFKDLGQSHSNPTPTAAPANLAPSGTYYFTERTAVRPEAKLNSHALTHYEKGQSVIYDRVLTAEGYQWLSYIGGSGNRRYVAIKKLASSVKPKDPETKPSQFKVGDQVTFHGVFKVNQHHGSLISSVDLAGGSPTSLNWIDPTPVDESNQQGQKAGDQFLNPGEYFIIPGKFKILQIDQKTNGIRVQIGSRATWVTMARAKKA